MIQHLNIHVLARAVIVDNNHILLCKALKKETDFYFLPGGHIEHNETAKEALIRELKEEAGVECTIRRFLGCLEYHFNPKGKDAGCHMHEYNMLFEVDSSELKHTKGIKQLEEHIELVWVDISWLPTLNLKPSALQKMIPVWLDSSFDKAYGSDKDN